MTPFATVGAKPDMPPNFESGQPHKRQRTGAEATPVFMQRPRLATLPKVPAMPKETLWAKRARKVRAAKAAQSAEPSPGLLAADDSDSDPVDEKDQPIRLPEILDLAAAAPLARELLARRGKPAVLDAIGIQRPGAPCLQVLLAAIRTWEGDGIPLTFVNCGPLLFEHLRFLGLEPGAFLKGVKS